MSGPVVFPYGALRCLEQWGLGGTFEWMLMQSSWTPNPWAEIFVADANPGVNEFSAVGYARQAVTGDFATVTLPDQLVFPCDSPSFGVLAGGSVATWLVLYHLNTNDADSELAAAMPCGYVADGVTAASFAIPSTGPLAVGFSCPVGFY